MLHFDVQRCNFHRGLHIKIAQNIVQIHCKKCIGVEQMQFGIVRITSNVTVFQSHQTKKFIIHNTNHNTTVPN